MIGRGWTTGVIAVLLAMPAVAQDRGGRAEEQSGPSGPNEQWAGLIPWRSIGPANMSGRMIDVEVSAFDSNLWYIATASGGLLRTRNSGATFDHLFDRETTVSLGDVALSITEPELVWVGTGEDNPRNSVSYGNGVYKSTDGGDTWTHMGLDETFQISKVIIHPTDPNIVYVGALGRLYGPNEERGLYKTTDGGENWEKILFVDDKTGVIDVAMHPTDPDVLLIATYERQRDGFDGNDPAKKNGPGSGLYRTKDGGKTFNKLSKGLPTVNMGRIGFDWYRGDPNFVYAVIETELTSFPGRNAGDSGMSLANAETGARVNEVAEEGAAATAGMKAGDIILSVDDVLVLNAARTQAEFRRREAGETLKLTFAREGEAHTAELTLVPYPEPEEGEEDQPFRGRGRNPFSSGLGGQSQDLQDQQGKDGFEHGGLFRSDDAGVSWERINSVNPRPMYYSQIRIDPSDSNHQWVLGTSLYRSSDGGATFSSGGAGRGVHVDHHAMWIDPTDGRHVILGNDGGLYETHDRGENWVHHNHLALGQFYHVEVGPRRNYMVYGGLQDNGTWGARHRSRSGSGPINEDWLSIGGGDGFVVRIDEEDPDTVYYESQNGFMGRRNLITGERGSIRPQAPEGENLRFNWKTPFILSHHNSRIFYCAANFVFRSWNRGSDLVAISPKITLSDEGAGSEIAESPRDASLLYVGTTDGALWRTKNGGQEWTDLLGFSESGIALTSAEGESADADAASSESSDAGEAEANGAQNVASSGQESSEEAADESPGSEGEEAPPLGKPLRELIPGPMWVTSLEPSRFETGRVYLALDGHRSDNDDPWVFVSEDFGDTWTSLRGNLPRGSSRCLREDHRNPNVLYLGTEFGVWFSADRGESWVRFHGDTFPTVAVHEIAQHEGSGEIVAGTHGRSLWIADPTPLRQFQPDILAKSAHLFAPNDVVLWSATPRRGVSRLATFIGENPPNAANVYYMINGRANSVKLWIEDLEGKKIADLQAGNGNGLQRAVWDLRITAGQSSQPPQEFRGFRFRGGRTASAGTYVAVLEVSGEQQRQRFTLERDPEYPETSYLAVEQELEELEAAEGGYETYDR